MILEQINIRKNNQVQFYTCFVFFFALKYHHITSVMKIIYSIHELLFLVWEDIFVFVQVKYCNAVYFNRITLSSACKIIDAVSQGQAEFRCICMYIIYFKLNVMRYECNHFVTKLQQLKYRHQTAANLISSNLNV